MPAKFWTADKSLSMAAMFISLCTLLVFVYQTNLVRKQQYMSVYPHLSFGNFGSGTEEYKFVLNNTGIGPAMLKLVQVKYRDTVYNEDVAWYLDRALTAADSVGYYYANLIPGQLIPANEMIEIAEIYDEKISSAHKLYKAINSDSLDIILEYESIYGERWRVCYRSGERVKLK